MKINYIFLVFAIFQISSGKIRHLEEANCHVTDAPPKKATPQIQNCYKFNDNTSCCDTVTDSKIFDVMNLFFPDTCMELNPAFVDYICLGCNPEQPGYVDETAKVVYICEFFAKKIWGDNLTAPTEKDGLFDCGFKYDSGSLRKDYEWGVDWFEEFEGDEEIEENYKERVYKDGYFNPKIAFKNFEHFTKYFKPRYFENYTITVVNNLTNCLGANTKVEGSSYLTVKLKILLLSYFLLLLL